MDGDLPEAGLAADLVRTALVKAGYEIRVKVEPWSRAYEGVVRDYAYDEAFDNHPGLNRVYNNQII